MFPTTFRRVKIQRQPVGPLSQFSSTVPLKRLTNTSPVLQGGKTRLPAVFLLLHLHGFSQEPGDTGARCEHDFPACGCHNYQVNRAQLWRNVFQDDYLVYSKRPARRPNASPCRPDVITGQMALPRSEKIKTAFLDIMSHPYGLFACFPSPQPRNQVVSLPLQCPYV